MANWCTTDVTVTGPKEQVEKLYKTMRELTDKKEPVSAGEWGSTWYGNLVTAFGGKWEKVCCRGYFFDLDYENGVLRWSDEFAWSEPYEVFAFLREKLPGISISFYAEEPGCDYFVTNRPDFAQYISDFDGEWEYHDSLKDLLKYAGEYFNRVFTTYSGLEKFCEERDCNVHKIDLVE